jgi:5-methylcytosine-specific restriction protein B
MVKINQILFIKVKPGDLWNLDRPQGSVIGGGGQTYINFGNISLEEVENFFDSRFDQNDNINVFVKSSYHGQNGINMTINFRTGQRTDYRITRQAIHQDRHPAWTTSVGFPQLPQGASSASDVKNSGVVDDIWFYIYKTNNSFCAGFTETNQVEEILSIEWKKKPISTTAKVALVYCNESTKVSDEILQKVSSLSTHPNYLLYGAPGTGKTYFMQKFYEELSNLGTEIHISSTEVTGPSIFNIESSKRISLDWVTFHQSYEYEQFVVGKQIDNKNSSGTSLVNLKDKIGVFLSSAAKVYPLREVDEAYIFIDEFNRGNVSKIFGQLITFLELDKRYDPNSKGAIPFPLPELSVDKENGEYNSVEDSSGNEVRFPYPYYLPKNIYIIAAMNSSDKAIAPLDAAFLRRFNKVEFRTNYLILEDISKNNNNGVLNSIDRIAIDLLKRLNRYILSEYGKDFELGQSFIFDVIHSKDDEIKKEKLVSDWKDKLLPQFLTYFDERSEFLISFLKFESAGHFPNYPFEIVSGIHDEDEYVEVNDSVIDSQDYYSILEFLAND